MAQADPTTPVPTISMRHRQDRQMKSGYPWSAAGELTIAEAERVHRPNCLAQLVDSKSEALVPALD